MSETFKVSGLTEEFLDKIDSRWKSLHFAGRAEYVRELIRRDLEAGERALMVKEAISRFGAPLSERTRQLGLADAEVGELIDGAVKESRRGRRRKAG